MKPSAKFTAPYLLNPSLAEYLQGQFKKFFGSIMQIDAGTSLSIGITPPGIEEVRVCLQANRTLKAQLEMKWSGSSEVFRISFPYPYNGVFIINSDLGRQPAKWIWHPRLVDIPGARIIRKYRKNQGVIKPDDRIRVSFPGGAFYEHKDKEPRSAGRSPTLEMGRNGLCLTPLAILDKKELGALYQGIQAVYEMKLFMEGKRLKSLDQTNLEKVYGNGKPQFSDEQDISPQRLLTYTAYLAENFIEKALSTVVKYSVEGSKLKKAINDGIKDHHGSLSESLWTALCHNSIYFDRWLAPVGKFIKEGQLHAFDPLNAFDAISQLTSFQRYNIAGNTLDQLPPIFRQNHPSFKGLVCPVQSPESKRVGITLSLARGVETDVIGRMVNRLPESEQDRDLGYGASLVPFYEFNDAPRAMMGAKNLKQAVPLKNLPAAFLPAVTTGHENEIIEKVRPLAEAGISIGCKFPATGADLLVAYMPWYGLNYEDAIVANKRLKDEGILDWDMIDEFIEYIQPEYDLLTPEEFGHAERSLTDFFSEKGLRKPGSVYHNTPIAFFGHRKRFKPIPLKCGGEPGVELELLSVTYSPPPIKGLSGGTIRWSVRRTLPLMLGDKLMGRYGNKGVISTFLDENELPCFPDDERLPRELRGKAVDLVLNPHGVISRMNIGQLLEAQTTFLYKLMGKKCPEHSGRAFGGNSFQTVLNEYKSFRQDDGNQIIDGSGKVRLVLPNGDPTLSYVAVGYQNVVRLKQSPLLKAHSRGWFKEGQNYNLVTGQPVGGRRRGGGQRIGEMEMWALAAHQAGHNLEGIFGRKSDPSAGKAKGHHNQTYLAIRDHLYALGIDISLKNGKAKFSMADTKIIKKLPLVSNGRTWELVTKGHFRCTESGCPRPLFGTKDEIVASGKTQKGNLFVKVKDLISHFGFVTGRDNADVIKLPDTRGGKIEKTVIVSLFGKGATSSKTDLELKCIIQKASINVDFKLKDKDYHAYLHLDRDFPLSAILDLPITCNTHKSASLGCDSLAYEPRHIPGGLCDPEIFGEIDLQNSQSDKWGYISLPKKVCFKFKTWKTSNIKKSIDVKIDAIPVLPLKYRFRYPERYGKNMIPKNDPFTDIYAEIISASLSGKSLAASIKKLYSQLEERITGKMGLFRRDGLGRRVNGSARLVIIPDPNIGWDECRLPVEILVPLLGEKMMQWQELGQAIDSIVLSNTSATSEDKPLFCEALKDRGFWQGDSPAANDFKERAYAMAKEVIERYLEANRQIRVILNRQPSLHKYSIMALRPAPLERGAGLVMKINPLVCKGFGADFDGDEMAIHMPFDDREHIEAANMGPTMPHNLISLADNSPLPSFDQDFVLGHFLIGKEHAWRTELTEMVDGLMKCTICNGLMSQPGLWDKKHGSRILKHICTEHLGQAALIIPKWMNLAFKAATEYGVSFGYSDLVEARRTLDVKLEDGAPSADLGIETDRLGNETIDFLTARLENQFNGIAQMVVSGAKGAKQSRQLIAARGYLFPGECGFGVDNERRFFIATPLVDGMSQVESFWAAMNGRSSMIDKKLGTPKAGTISRKLVLACWHWHVQGNDCGAKKPGEVVYCKQLSTQRICGKCYGPVVGYKNVPDGFPAGLIAAQSFGERGTQLSMQSFHTGAKQLSIDEVVSLLNGTDPNNKGKNWFETRDDATEFVKEMRKQEGYSSLDERHLLLIWLIIHNSAANRDGQKRKKTRVAQPRGMRKKGQGEPSLNEAIKIAGSPLMKLVGPSLIRNVWNMAEEMASDDLTRPYAKLLLGKPPMYCKKKAGRKYG